MAVHKVYLVDDDYLTLDRYWARRRLFMDSGFEICGAETDPHKALEAIRTMRPDAVLSDLKMPGMSGIELLEEIMRETLRPLFVIVSAYTEYKEIRKLFLTYGFDYLVKPVADSDLIELLNRLAAKIDYTQPVIERKTQSYRLDEITQYLREHSHINHSLETIGERFSIKSGALCNLFANHMNTTFSTYVNTIRMERAVGLLLTTHKKLKEIAVICGYGDAFYFTRVFHKTYGMSPSRFREEKRGSPFSSRRP